MDRTERNWKEDWDACNDTVKLIQHMILPMPELKAYREETARLRYWLQEVKTLREQLAHANCDWQREKNTRHLLAAELAKEKHRANKLERILKSLISDADIVPEYENEVMSMARAQEAMYE